MILCHQWNDWGKGVGSHDGELMKNGEFILFSLIITFTGIGFILILIGSSENKIWYNRLKKFENSNINKQYFREMRMMRLINPWEYKWNVLKSIFFPQFVKILNK